VHPTRQNQGIGRKIVEFLDKEYGIDKALVVLQTNATAEDFYKKLGWETVNSTDIDLSEWAGKGRGYGVHRSPQMVRYPKV
jgi:ribosomal protein S18 acetylase RimI-like enzyme